MKAANGGERGEPFKACSRGGADLGHKEKTALYQGRKLVMGKGKTKSPRISVGGGGGEREPGRLWLGATEFSPNEKEKDSWRGGDIAFGNHLPKKDTSCQDPRGKKRGWGGPFPAWWRKKKDALAAKRGGHLRTCRQKGEGSVVYLVGPGKRWVPMSLGPEGERSGVVAKKGRQDQRIREGGRNAPVSGGVPFCRLCKERG